MNSPTTVLLVDDHRIMRDGLALLVGGQTDLTIVGDASDGESAWRAVQELHPHVIVMDLDLPGENGVALTKRVRAEFPGTRVLILTGDAAPHQLNAALEAGAGGVIFKANAGAELIGALRVVAAGGFYLSPEAAAMIRPSDVTGRTASKHSLTPKETEVMKRIADGYSTKEIAFALKVSTKTVETHRTKIMEKLGLRSVAELTKSAIRLGLTRP